MLSRDALRADLVRDAFAPSAPPPRIGAEAELLVIAADTRLPVPIHADEGPASLPLLRRVAAGNGWTEEDSGYGAPRWTVPGRGIVSYEPGGQIEFSAAPQPSVSALRDCLRSVILPLRSAAADAGIELLSVGIDPYNPIDRIPLQLHGERYRRMTEYLAGIGPSGPRMMRQTASFQVNLDWGPASEAWLRWRVLNAAAPYLLAIFANSSAYAGAPTGHRSFRAAIWRALDPRRTGIFACGPDALGEYLRWALRAPAILLVPPGAPARPFGEHLRRGGVGMAEWHTHLSTLFPEVRPKGFLELRSPDAVAPEWYAAPLVLVSGLLYDPRTLRAAVELLPPPCPARLVRAGEMGLGDPALARTARDLWDLALAGCAALGATWADGAALAEARDFADRYTRRGLAPADDTPAAAFCQGRGASR